MRYLYEQMEAGGSGVFLCMCSIAGHPSNAMFA
jgi:hypothetical protein